MSSINYWSEMVLLTLDELAFLSLNLEEEQIPSEIDLNKIKDSNLYSKANDAKNIFIDHINGEKFKISDLSYVHPHHKQRSDNQKHFEIRIHKIDIAKYYIDIKKELPFLLQMPKINNPELSTKDQINILIGILSMQYVNMTGNISGSSKDPVVDVIKEELIRDYEKKYIVSGLSGTNITVKINRGLELLNNNFNL
jgi:hypothetical protein